MELSSTHNLNGIDVNKTIKCFFFVLAQFARCSAAVKLILWMKSNGEIFKSWKKFDVYLADFCLFMFFLNPNFVNQRDWSTTRANLNRFFGRKSNVPVWQLNVCWDCESYICSLFTGHSCSCHALVRDGVARDNSICAALWFMMILAGRIARMNGRVCGTKIVLPKLKLHINCLKFYKEQGSRFLWS